MGAYNLDEDEIVITQDSNVTNQNGRIVTLVLTNKNIIELEHGFLGNTKTFHYYPLTDLKENRGNPNVLVGKSPAGKTRLEVFFVSSQRYYSFKGILAEKKWASAITKAYRQRVKEIDRSEHTSLSAAKYVAGKVHAAKSAILKNQQKAASSKCPFCGAVVTGSKGEEIECEFCESTFIIK